MPTPHLNLISCSYCNSEQQVQVVQVSKLSHIYLEKVVMPNQCIYFNVPANTYLEIYEGSLLSSIHSDTIPCEQLRLSKIDEYVTKETNSKKPVTSQLVA